MTRPFSNYCNEKVATCVRCNERFLESFGVMIGGEYVCLDCKTVGDVVDGEQPPIEQRFDALTQVVNNALKILDQALNFSVAQDNGSLDTPKVQRELAERRLNYLLWIRGELRNGVNS